MELEEFKYLVDRGYITDTQIGSFYLNPENIDALTHLTEEELVEREYLTQVGFAPKYHSFKIVSTPEDCIVKINNEEKSFGMFRDGSKITWSVSKEGYVTQIGEVESLNMDDKENVDLQPEIVTAATETKEEPVVETKLEEPVVETKLEEPVVETKLEEPVEETKEEPVVETKSVKSTKNKSAKK